MLETRQLLAFDAVVRTGTFAAAARELGYTQPGVSQQIRALERRLGTALFTRVGRGLRLNEQGEVLAAQTPELLSDVRALEERVGAVARLRSGLVRVCAFPSANAALVPSAISRMRSNSLGAEVELFEAEPPESVDGLITGDYDVAVSFRYDEETNDTEETVSTVLLREPMLLFMPEGHPLARRQRIRLSELKNERWVAGCQRCRAEFVNTCSASGFAPRIDVTTDDNLAVQSYVASGLGLALMPRMVQSFVKHPKVVARSVTPARVRTITATTLTSNRSSPAVARMVDSLVWAANNEAETTIDKQ